MPPGSAATESVGIRVGRGCTEARSLFSIYVSWKDGLVERYRMHTAIISVFVVSGSREAQRLALYRMPCPAYNNLLMLTKHYEYLLVLDNAC